MLDTLLLFVSLYYSVDIDVFINKKFLFESLLLFVAFLNVVQLICLLWCYYNNNLRFLLLPNKILSDVTDNYLNKSFFILSSLSTFLCVNFFAFILINFCLDITLDNILFYCCFCYSTLLINGLKYFCIHGSKGYLCNNNIELFLFGDLWN